MMWLWALLTLLGLLGLCAGLWIQELDFCSKTELNHLVMDEASGMVYRGIVNMISLKSARKGLVEWVTLINLASIDQMLLHVCS